MDSLVIHFTNVNGVRDVVSIQGTNWSITKEDTHVVTNNVFPNTQAPTANNHNSKICACGSSARVAVVKKEGVNFGKNFYCCPTGACRYFEFQK